jgi:hypothetical protein
VVVSIAPARAAAMMVRRANMVECFGSDDPLYSCLRASFDVGREMAGATESLYRK